MRRHFRLIALFVCVVSPLTALAQTPIDPAGINGALVLAGSYQITPETFDKFVELAGGAKAKIVILKIGNIDPSAQAVKGLTAAAKKAEAAPPQTMNFADAKMALAEATGFWLHVNPGDAFKAEPIAGACRALLKRGGVVGTAQPGVWMIGSHQRASNPNAPSLHLLPDSMIELQPGSLRRPPGTKGVVGYRISRNGTMLVKGRTISVLGSGIDIYVGQREITLEPKKAQDLTALRRAARDLAESFPPKNPEPPIVEKGTLVIVGGGGSPEGLNKKFVEYAGGAGKACIVIFPTANESPLPKRDNLAAAFKKAGVRKATVLYGKTRTEVESKEFLDTLKEATGLWFDGGRQWRFVDCYENTNALPLMFDVLARGGVIGGTSAGATIQGEYLCRGGVFNNFDIRYEGYERGLGFLKGVAIDQHFTQRKRQPQMTQLMKTYPQYLGIGLDEATAIVVKGQIAEIIGKGKVHFYDSNRKMPDGQLDFEALSAGARYDLKERKAVSTQK